MKKLVLFFSMLAAIAVTSCSKDEGVGAPSNEREPITIGISTIGISYEDLPASRVGADGDLFAAQIYEVNGDVATPYANGLFDDWSALSFEGYTNTTYKVVATLVVDGAAQISSEAGVYGKPFSAAISTEFVYSNTELSGLSASTASLVDGAEYSVPNIDRYYGYAQKSITKEDSSIATNLKRMAFGIKTAGVAEDVTVAIEGAPEVVLSDGELAIFSIQDFEAAYTADESSKNYSESIKTTLKRASGAAQTMSVEYARNKFAKVSFDTASGDLVFGFETPIENFAILTFEDADYTAGENYIGGNSWTSLIDSKEYEGSLLYSDNVQYTWTDTNNTFLNGVVNEGVDYNTFEPNWKFWTGGIVVSNYYMPVTADAPVSYTNQLSLSNGSAGAAGHNGSANFAVVFDAAAGGAGGAVYLSFGDGVARTVDHLFISSTSQLESAALYGNGIPAPIADGDTYTVTAVGLDANNEETGINAVYEFVHEGNLVTGWNKWDLSSLGNVAKICFKVTSNVTNEWGMAMPAYFAIDDVAVIVK